MSLLSNSRPLTVVEFFVVIAVGRLMVWLVMSNGITKRVIPVVPPLFRELLECDLCTGFWVFLLIAPFVRVGLFDNPVLDALAFAAVAAFVSHVMALGIIARFGTVTYD